MHVIFVVFQAEMVWKIALWLIPIDFNSIRISWYFKNSPKFLKFLLGDLICMCMNFQTNIKST